MNSKSKRSNKTKGIINRFLMERPKLKTSSEILYVSIMCLISAFIYAFGYRVFIAPDPQNMVNLGGAGVHVHFVSGGVSGMAQNVVKLFHDVLNLTFLSRNNIQSIAFFTLNIPVFLLAWFKIGKRFTIFSMINVALVSLFISIIPVSWEQMIIYDTQLTRTLLAGGILGASNAVAFKAGISTGGLDIVSYYFANRKSEGVGKYSILFNSVVVGIYFALNLIQPDVAVGAEKEVLLPAHTIAITSFVSSIIYLLSNSFIVDLFNVRNKKTQLQIMSDVEGLEKILIANFPHGATVTKGFGAYSGREKNIIYMTISNNEITSAVALIQDIDPNAFVNVIELRQVFGRFYIKPLK